MNNYSIQLYYQEIEKIVRYGGSKKETAIRNAFYALLNEYARQRDLVLVAEISTKTKQGKTITPDGTLKDHIRNDWGYWESKDEHDDIDIEIQNKFQKGYPTDNILFEDGKTAILYQQGAEAMRIDILEPDALHHILTRFISYERPEVHSFREAIEHFSRDIPSLTQSIRAIISEQQQSNKQLREAQSDFLELCLSSINPAIVMEDVAEMMVQHILTADIFNTIFNDPHYHRENNVAGELERVVSTFFTGDVRRKVLGSTKHYYSAIASRAAMIADHHEKQRFLKVVYEAFYKAYNPKAADRLGVVYTPNEVVRFMVESTDFLLHRHFNKFLEDRGVEILDPATGTGTFICDIIDYVRTEKLHHKYAHELHANEVAILPYYISNLNIEFTYAQKTGSYAPFNNLCFVDTLDKASQRFAQAGLFGLSAENTSRIRRQNEKPISVIIGNPPYNANQLDENDNNKNRAYPNIDNRIKETFIRHSTAQKTKVYDMYARFYRWAFDRLGSLGVVTFVTNRSFIDSRTFDGFRKVAASEFDHIYIIDLGGDVRANPKLSGTKHNVFGIQTGVAIMLLVKTEGNKITARDEKDFEEIKKDFSIVGEPMVEYNIEIYLSPKGCRINYVRLPEMATAAEKLFYLSTMKIGKIDFERIRPDIQHNWVNQVENNWEGLLPICNKETKAGKASNAIFGLYTSTIKTNRDEWVFDVDAKELEKKIKYFIERYKAQLKSGKTGNNDLDYSIKWSRDLKLKLVAKKTVKYNGKKIIEVPSRPFMKRYFYSEKILNDVLTSKHYEICGPLLTDKILIINIPGEVSIKPFQALATELLCDYSFLEATQCLPLYRFDTSGKQTDNITDWALRQFQSHYQDTNISKTAVFNYVYAVLHNPAYREKYALNLKREFPRIPFYDDFWKWESWGNSLLNLHIHYETAGPFGLKREDKPYQPKLGIDPRIDLKAKLRADKTTGSIILDNYTTLSGIPPLAWEYKLGNRSALEWVLDQYKERKPSDPTIAEKFDHYRFTDYKDRVVDLLDRLCRVSVETMGIVSQMSHG